MLGCRKQPMHSSANSNTPSSQPTDSRPHLRPITTRSATLLPTEVHPCSPTPPQSQSLPRPRPLSCPIARQSISLFTQPTASNLFSITYQPLPPTEALRPTRNDTYHPPVLGNIYIYYLVNVYYIVNIPKAIESPHEAIRALPIPQGIQSSQSQFRSPPCPQSAPS